MNQSSTNPQNPYVSPKAIEVVLAKSPNLRRAFTALIGVILPCALVWSYMDASYLWPVAEPENSVMTPNPERAPWYFVSGTENWMVLVNVRLAIFAHRWTYLAYIAFVIWPLVGPPIFSRRANAPTAVRRVPRLGLFTSSLLIGIFLAWPWLAAIFVPSWLGP